MGYICLRMCRNCHIGNINIIYISLAEHVHYITGNNSLLVPLKFSLGGISIIGMCVFQGLHVHMDGYQHMTVINVPLSFTLGQHDSQNQELHFGRGNHLDVQN